MRNYIHTNNQLQDKQGSPRTPSLNFFLSEFRPQPKLCKSNFSKQKPRVVAKVMDGAGSSDPGRGKQSGAHVLCIDTSTAKAK